MPSMPGAALDKYVHEQGLTQRQLLELMRTVCEAVQHAHERGVIHRDLKPSNILVTENGQPQVLDFGVAKAFLEEDWDLRESTDGEAAGTPSYMSPEQAAGRGEQIDTRTDVYSLGVVLFRLLTGESPHDLSGTRYEVLRRIAEEEVRRPREITKDVDRELEALLLKALAHDPKDRYASAGALAQDIENYLTGEPLTARPPTTAYFLRKRIRKYRVPVAIACSVLAVLIGMAVFAYVRVVQERTRTEQAKDNVQNEADKAKATYEFLEGILTSVDPEKALGREISLREALDEAAEDVGTQLADQPEVEAAVRTTIGDTYLALGQYDAAEMQFSRALEIRRRVLRDDQPDTLMSMNNLAVARWRKGKLNEAAAMFRQCLEIRRRILGEEHPDTLRSMNNLAVTLRDQGKLDEAEALHRRTLEIRQRDLGEEHPATLTAMKDLATSLYRRGKLDEAEAMFREGLAKSRLALSDDELVTAQMMNNLACILEERGKSQEAEPLRRESVEIHRRVFDKKHGATEAGPVADEPAVKTEREGDALAAAGAEGNVFAYDGFDGKLGLNWQILNPDPSHYSLTKEPGALTITTQDGAFCGANTDYENLFLIDCPASSGEDFQLTTCISSFKPVANWNQAGLICYNDDDNCLKFVYEWSGGLGGRRVFTVGSETEGAFHTVYFLAYQQVEKVWLRVTKRGNRYRFSTSLDGKSFVRQGFPIGDSAGLFRDELIWGDGSVKQVGIVAKNGPNSTAPEVDASFDFFEVSSVPGKAEPEEQGVSASGEEMNVETPK